MPESRQAEAMRQAATVARARAHRRRRGSPPEDRRTAHEWWLDVVRRRIMEGRREA